MKNIYTILNKCVLIILAVQLMNMSLINLNNSFCDVSYKTTARPTNTIDCAFEYITEHILGWDNYVPENGNRANHQANHLHKIAVICWYAPNPPASYDHPVHPYEKRYPLTTTTLIPGHNGEINPPPPKA